MVKIIIWFLTFALSVFLLLIIPNSYSNAVWVTLIFDVIAFISQLILWLVIFNKTAGAKETFNSYPVMVVSAMYLVMEFVMCIITGTCAVSISFKLAVIINGIILIAVWIILLMLIMAKEHVEKVDSRQKDHHMEL